MLKILPKILAYRSYFKYKFPKVLPMNLTISLLYSCNSRCKTCNIYKKKAKNLSIDEYRKIFKNSKLSPFWVTVSGGEPFLREDLLDLLIVICSELEPSIVNIPTNGSLTYKVIETIKKITKLFPKIQFVVNLSIDGIGIQHDKIRGIKKSYHKVTNTYDGLQNLREKRNIKNLSIGIHTVISKFNAHEFANITRTLLSKNPDSYITEIAENRVELGTMKEDISPKNIDYAAAVDFLIHNIKQKRNLSRFNRITQSFRIEYYKLVKRIIRSKKQIIPCYSGIASAQISPEGDIWSCCIRSKSLGNLRKNNYNFKEIWFSKEAKKDRKFIKKKKCYCPLANASYTNMLMHFPTLTRVFYRSFIKWWS